MTVEEIPKIIIKKTKTNNNNNNNNNTGDKGKNRTPGRDII